MPLYRDGIFIAKLPMLPFSLHHFLGSLFFLLEYMLFLVYIMFQHKNVKSYSDCVLGLNGKVQLMCALFLKVNGCTLQVG
jgi:hypothetical protein